MVEFQLNSPLAIMLLVAWCHPNFSDSKIGSRRVTLQGKRIVEIGATGELNTGMCAMPAYVIYHEHTTLVVNYIFRRRTHTGIELCSDNFESMLKHSPILFCVSSY
ncbi:hypothetical protein ACFE04_009174 [Oxalis oulophora]